MGISERILAYRKKNEISQKDLARKCKISSQTLWSVEKGDQHPTDVTVEKIEKVIGKEEENAAPIGKQD